MDSKQFFRFCFLPLSALISYMFSATQEQLSGVHRVKKGDFRSTPPESQTDRQRDFISTRSLHDITFLPKSDGIYQRMAFVPSAFYAVSLWPGLFLTVWHSFMVWIMASWKVNCYGRTF